MAEYLDLGPVRAVLCDLDGTLIDSTAAVMRVWNGWMAEHGIEPWPEHPHGIPAKQVIAMLAEDRDLDVPAEASELERREIADTDGVVALPGAAELLSPDAPWGLDIAIVTSCTAPLADTRLHAAGLPAPSIVVTAERTQLVKPNPDPYLLAAELLGLEPAVCVVLEDAPAGIAAGLAAGMQVVAVRSAHQSDATLAAAHLIVDDAAAFAEMLPMRVALDVDVTLLEPEPTE
jgi:sugar-phosphatase